MISTTVAMINTFQRLRLVSQFTTQQQQQGRITQGAGQVVVEQTATDTLIFHETGRRQVENGRFVDFTNVYRWQWLGNGQLSLSHLRRGIDDAVHLLNFSQSLPNQWQTITPHHCGSDIYQATLSIEEQAIYLQWSIQGAKKDIEIRVIYQ